MPIYKIVQATWGYDEYEVEASSFSEAIDAIQNGEVDLIRHETVESDNTRGITYMELMDCLGEDKWQEEHQRIDNSDNAYLLGDTGLHTIIDVEVYPSEKEKGDDLFNE